MKSTKEIIVDCVVNEIKKEGIANISMNKIAGLANIGKSTIYEYFKSKDDLIFHTMSKMIKDYVETILGQDLDMPFKECLYSHLETILEISDECYFFERIVTQNANLKFEVYDIGEVIVRAINLIMDRLIAIINKGIDEKILKPILDYEIIILPTMGLIQGMVMQYTAKQVKFSKTEVIDLMYDNILKIVNN